MPKSCCCYSVDQRYLLPALVSATQARANTTDPDIDIIIFCFGVPSEIVSFFSAICSRYDIKIRNLSVDHLRGLTVHYASFFICDFLDEIYENILLVDADTQIDGSLDDLLSFNIPNGKVLAARDPISFGLDQPHPHWDEQRKYLMSLGLSQDQAARYFNSGVVMCNRQHWMSLCDQFVRFYKEKHGKFRYYDQDIINFVVGTDHTDISIKWNYPVFFDNVGLSISTPAVVRHYMSKPRPWDGSFSPWKQSGLAPYLKIINLHPELRSFHRPFRGAKWLRYVLQQNYKRYSDRSTWHTKQMEVAVASYEQRVAV